MKKFCILFIFILSTLLILPLNKVVFAEEKNINEYNTTDYSNFNIISETEFFVVNKSTNKIEHFKDGNVTLFGEYGDNIGQFTTVKFFKKLQNGEFCILDSLNKLHFFDESFSHIKTVQTIYDNGSYFSLGVISQMVTDIYSNIYMLDTTNNYILKVNSSSDYFSILNKDYNLENAIFTVLNNSNNLILVKDNILINVNSYAQTNLSFSPKAIFSDAFEYIYLVKNDNILKYDTNLHEINSIELEIGSNYNINLENGTIYYIVDNKIVKCENFAANIENFTPPINLQDETPLNQQVIISTINNAVNLLKNPYSNTIILKLNINDKVIKLAKTSNLSTNFAYVMLKKDDETYIGYINENYLIDDEIENNVSKIIPVRNDIHTFKYPLQDKTNSIKLLTLNSNLEYTKTRTISLYNKCYCELFIDNAYYYVNENETLTTDTSYINVYLATNAKINLYNKVTEIDLYDTINKDNIIYTLTNSQNVRIINKNKDISEIELIINNNIVRCFVETKYLSNQNTFIIPATIILSIISIVILIVLVIKLKKEKCKV